MKKAFLIVIIFIALLSYFLNKEVKHSVIINKSIQEVWSYASDSTKANEWSVYFHHISPLPGVEDGKIGSLRRCFRREDESGPTWDEEVLQVSPLKYRQLRTFNLKNFNDPILSRAQFKVHQRYESISPSKTKLTFASEYSGPLDWNVIKALLPATDETKRIFRLNLENIKAGIEEGSGYQRPHPYEETNIFDQL